MDGLYLDFAGAKIDASRYSEKTPVNTYLIILLRVWRPTRIET